MKRVKLAHALLLCIVWFSTGQAWSNEAPKIYVQSYVNQIVSGGHHSMAIDENGYLWAWGNNGSGRLGNVDAGLKASIPVPVNTINGNDQLSGMISVDGGFSHSIALLENGKVLAWGNNNTRQLGNDSIKQSSFLPVYVNGPGDETYLTNVIAVSAGKHHSVALCSDGTVWTWGTNTDGQLGNDKLPGQMQSRPAQVVNSDGTGFLTDIVAISAGSYHTLALKKNGTVLSWGKNDSGQLGLGLNADNYQTPLPINELTGITHISAGESHSLARKSNGTLWAWGNNESGQLGYPTNNNSYSNLPHQVLASDGVNNLMNVVNISAGYAHSLALINDSTIKAWGNNDYGQLGDGSETSTMYPTSVKRANTILENVVEISAGNTHSIARLKDGQVMAWGGNNDGQLGNNGKRAILPDYVLNYNAESSLQLGEFYCFVQVNEDQMLTPISFVLRDTNGQEITLSATSSNESLVLANSIEFNHNNQPITVDVPSEEGVNVLFSFQTLADQFGSGKISIVATDSLGASDTARLKIMVLPINDPPMISYIENVEIYEDSSSGLIPFTVLDIDGDDLTVTAQSLNTTLIPKEGLVLSGNSNNRTIRITPNPNQFGAADIILSVSDASGLTSQTHFYANVKPLNDLPGMRVWPGIRQIVCGFFHNIALKDDWTVWAWGYNGAGQLGDGTIAPHNLPIQVKGPNGLGWLTDIINVAAGNQHSVALTGDGHVLAWGGNTFGQLGNASFESSYVPIYVLKDNDEPFDDVIAIASGTNHVLMLTEENELWAWGQNENGQLANNNPVSFNRPLRITGLPSNRIVQIAAGDSHSMVLLDNGEIWSWGDNAFGQLGIGNVVSTMIPTVVIQDNGNPLTNIVSISAGSFHTLALSNDGYIWAFGDNENGQLGNGSNAALSKPAKVQHPDNGQPLSEIVYIAAGTSHSLALQNSGNIWAWGNNKYGQLGIGSDKNQYLPQKTNCTNIPIDQILTIDAGKQHSVLHAGFVWAWGANSSSQLGNGTPPNGSLIPIQTRSSDGNDNFSPGIFPLEFYTVDGIPAQPVLVSLYDLETQPKDLVLSATSYDTQILPQSNVLILGSGVNRQIILTPDKDMTGKVVVDLILSDNTDDVSKQLTLGVNKFSLSPTISDISDLTGNEDQLISNIAFRIDDPDTPIDQLTLQITSSNTELIPNHPDMLILSGDDKDKNLTIKPLENKNGETQIVIRISDGINISRSSFNVTIQPINDPPTISTIENQVILSEEYSKSIGFTISDVDTEPENLTTWAISSNTSIVPNDATHMIISGDASKRTLAITPSKDDAGELTITVFVSDGIETQSTHFRLIVQSYKKSPQISDIENQIIQEDSEITVDFIVTDADSDPNELSFIITSSNKYVIPNDSANLSLSGTGINRSLFIKPKADQVGSVRITIETRDLDNLFDQTSFMVTVQNINDPPTISNIDDMEIKENTSSDPIEFTIHDAELAAENLFLTVTSENELVVPNNINHIKLEGQDTNRTLTIIPLEDTIGETMIRIQLSDGEIPVWESFTLKVVPQNFPPEISPIGPQVTEVGNALKISFTVHDAEMPSYLIKLSVESSDPSVVPNDDAHLTIESGNGDERHLTITPLDDESGQLTITIILQDDLSTVEKPFLLIVNHPPHISSVSDQETDEDTPISPLISFTVNDQDTATDKLILTARSANPKLVPNDDMHLKFQGSGLMRFLYLLPAANQSGTTQIEVDITDGYSVMTTRFKITVNEVNDPPFIEPVPRVFTDEDTAKSAIPITIGDYEHSTDYLQISVSSDNATLLPLQNIQLISQAGGHYLSLTPAANQNGIVMVSLHVSDPEGLTANSHFILQVKSVNDAPVAFDQSHDIRMNIPFSNKLIANDIDGDSLTYSISEKPEKGELTLLSQSTGEYIFHPYTEQYGQDSFLFVVSDGLETSVDGTVAIHVHDDIPPEIILNGLNPDYILKGNQFIDRGVTSAYDNADGNLIDHVEIIGIVNEQVTGTYHLTYRVKDNSGNTAQITREVVVMENSGQLQGTIAHLPDLITSPENDIRVQLLDAITYRVLRETQLTMDYQTLRFKFLYLPFQTYILRLIVSDHQSPPAYLTETKDQQVLFQINNQQVYLSVPDLTQTNLSSQLTVSLNGDYKPLDTYQYTIIDYLNGDTIVDEIMNTSQFSTFLKNGSYRLIILAKGYEPFEYIHGDGNSYIRMNNEDVDITALLNEDANYYPDAIRIDASHTIFETPNEKGFNMWFVRKEYNSDAIFRVSIQSEEDEIWLHNWDGIDIVDNHPYVYTWTVLAAEEGDHPLYLNKEARGMDTQYTVVFHFYQWTNLIHSYTINYISQSPNSTQISPEKKELQDFVNDTVRYETQSETSFYPLAGINLNISFKDSTGKVQHKGVSIPPIPLDYLDIPDNQKELTASEELIANVKYYTFAGNSVSDSISIDFRTSDGDSVVFNSKNNRNANAPTITVPLHLNLYSPYLEGIQQNRLSLSKDILHVVVQDDSDPNGGFQKEELPYLIQDDGLVLVKINHLSTITLEINDNWNAFKNKGLDDRRCFIKIIYGSNHLYQLFLWLVIFIGSLGLITRGKGKQ
jgi:alpha-tubulin suppressor-like RCC1 family protein